MTALRAEAAYPVGFVSRAREGLAARDMVLAGGRTSNRDFKTCTPFCAQADCLYGAEDCLYGKWNCVYVSAQRDDTVLDCV